MKQLLIARGFKEMEPDPWDEEDNLYEWIKTANRKKHHLTITDELFDEEKKLKFLKRTEWKDEYIEPTEIEEPEDDELPF